MKNIPYIPQGDYSGNNSDISKLFYGIPADNDEPQPQTVGYKGCGIVSLAMAKQGLYNNNTGKSDYEAVKDVRDFALAMGDYDGGTVYKEDDGTNIKGLIPAYLKANTQYLASYNVNSAIEAYSAVKDGDIAIISVNGTGELFTTGEGHIIVMANIIDDKIEIHNPNGIGYDNQDRLYTLNEVKSAWKYGVVIGVTDVFNTVKHGDRGENVRRVETALVQKGHSLIGSDGKDYNNNFFGSLTARKVKEFQEANNLPSTGKVDEATWNKLLDDKPEATENSFNKQAVELAIIGLRKQIDGINQVIDTLEKSLV